jgi:NodT family efflux transporter outer membrane factor (OMF) lipoprotein
MKTLQTAIVSVALLASACSLIPEYQRPSAKIPESFKEQPGWRPAEPADHLPREDWWTLFGDVYLSDLAQRARVSNQTVAAAVAAYDQARAVVRAQRSALWPVIRLQADELRFGFSQNNTAFLQGTGVSTTTPVTTVPGTGAPVTATPTTSQSGTNQFITRHRYDASIGTTWELDVFGRLRAAVAQAGALAQASAGDLAGATLAVQSELVLNYVQLRALDALVDSFEGSVIAYERALQITRNQYLAGTVTRLDVLQAETQVSNARADTADLRRQRALAEHAIAVLIGENPSTFAVPKTPWQPQVPEVPAVLPSALLERRPDVAAAERRVAAANAAIGIARSAYFPIFTFSGDVGFTSSQLAELFEASSYVWSLGLSGAMTVLDFGGRSAGVQQARAAYEQTVALYRQIVLAAFQQTEDQLAALRFFEIEQRERLAAERSANQAERLSLNQYVAGTIAYSNVILAQITAYTAREAAVTATLSRQIAVISLIQALGGYWSGQLPKP